MTSRTRKLMVGVVVVGLAVVVVLLVTVSREPDPMQPLGIRVVDYDFAKSAPLVEITNHSGFSLVYDWFGEERRLAPHEAQEVAAVIPRALAEALTLVGASSVTVFYWRQPTGFDRCMWVVSRRIGINPKPLKRWRTNYDLPPKPKPCP